MFAHIDHENPFTCGNSVTHIPYVPHRIIQQSRFPFLIHENRRHPNDHIYLVELWNGQKVYINVNDVSSTINSCHPCIGKVLKYVGNISEGFVIVQNDESSQVFVENLIKNFTSLQSTKKIYVNLKRDRDNSCQIPQSLTEIPQKLKRVRDNSCQIPQSSTEIPPKLKRDRDNSCQIPPKLKRDRDNSCQIPPKLKRNRNRNNSCETETNLH
jgi:hypothetical protein